MTTTTNKVRTRKDIHSIRRTIKDYLELCNQPSEHTLLCFVGMIETGEATLADFRACGGEQLQKCVAQMMDRN